MRCCLIALLWLATSAALATPPRVAVLELRDQAGLGGPPVTYLTDRVRAAAVAEGGRLFLITRENILAHLPPGVDLSACEGDCEVETGRNIGADFVISGAVLRLGGALRASLKAHDTRTGALIAAETASGDDPAALEAPITAAARRIFTLLPGAAATGGGAVHPGLPLVAPERVVNAAIPDDTGFLVVETLPAGARVFIGGEDVGVAPLQREQPVGRYTIEARHPLHHPAAQRLDLGAAGARLVLTLPPAHGRLEVGSVPSGGTVRLNGEAVGETPWTAEGKPSGSYAVTVEAPCHQPAAAELQVRDGETTRRTFALVRRCGALQVLSDPPGAAVVLNGAETGVVTPARFTDLQPGVVRLALRLDGYGTTVHRATVEPQEERKIDVRHDPKYGALSVVATQRDGTPCQGELRVDGRVVGATPWKGRALARRLDLTVRCPEGVARGRVVVGHNEKARAELTVGAGLGGPDHCELALASCLEQAGIDDRVYRRCFQDADRCGGGEGQASGGTSAAELRRSAAPSRPKRGGLAWLVQVDRLRDYYVLQGVIWLGTADAPVRLGLAGSALNIHVPEETPAGFTPLAVSFGTQLLVRARLGAHFGLLLTGGLVGGWVLCDDGPSDGTQSAEELENAARCAEAVGPRDPGVDPDIAFGLLQGRLLAEARLGALGLNAGWVLVTGLGDADLLDLGASGGLSLGVHYDF